MFFLVGLGSRYLLVKRGGNVGTTEELNEEDQLVPELSDSDARYMTLDPLNRLTVGGEIVRIPEHYEYKLDALLERRRMECEGVGVGESGEEFWDWDWDSEDEMILFGEFNVEVDVDVVEVAAVESERGSDDTIKPRLLKDEWTHDETWVDPNPNSNLNLNPLATGYQLLPPPSQSTPQALLALQREFKTMMKEQETALKNGAGAVSELGWFILSELMEDNLFRWMVE